MDVYVPSERETWDTIGEVLDSERYAERLNGSLAFKIGFGADIVYAAGGGWRHPIRAYRLGGLIGVNTRIVDDLLDGDGCGPVEDRYGLGERYLAAFRTGEMQAAVEDDVERAAYRAATMLYDVLEPHGADVIDRVHARFTEMRDLVVEEDKSTLDGYREYATAAGGVHGAVLASALDVLPDFEATPETEGFGHDFGFAVQVVDDMFDDDIGLSAGDLKPVYDEALEKVRRHDGVLPRILPRLGRTYPPLYRAFRKINRDAVRPSSGT